MGMRLCVHRNFMPAGGDSGACDCGGGGSGGAGRVLVAASAQ